MGAVSALMGRDAAHACTAAVESVIDEHYQDQLKELSLSDDHELVQLVTKCHAEECEHRDIANRETGSSDLEADFPILTTFIKHITKASIEIAKRI